MDADPTPGTVTADDGTTLRLWELDPGADEAVCFVHGSITSSRALFSPPVVRTSAPDDASGSSADRRSADHANGRTAPASRERRDRRASHERDGDPDRSYSWLHAAARGGRAAFALDVRGYGDSDRPPEMDEPPEANDPPVRAPTAARDVAAAVDALAERFAAVHLVGVSWGTMVCGYYLAEHDAPVASLVQCAPVYEPPWSFAEIAAALNVDADLDAYYRQRYDAVSERQGGDDALFEAIWRTQVASNQGVDSETYLAQSGALADSKAAAEGERVYDAGAVDVPTLVVRGSADAISVREDAVGLYDALDCEKEYAEVGGADHYAMHGARRAALYAATNAFHDRV